MFYSRKNSYFIYDRKDTNVSYKEFFSKNIDNKYEVIEAVGKRKLVFMAVKEKNTSGDLPNLSQATFLLLAVTKSRPNSFNNIAYCFINENEIKKFVGLNTAAEKCPEKILSLLSPPEILYQQALIDQRLTTSEFQEIKNWRDLSWRKINQAKLAKKVKPGDIIQLNEPCIYYDTLTRKYKKDETVFEFKSRNVFYSLNGQHVFIDRWRKRDFEILKNEPAKQQKEKFAQAKEEHQKLRNQQKRHGSKIFIA